jgi:hypothetical protein
MGIPQSLLKRGSIEPAIAQQHRRRPPGGSVRAPALGLLGIRVM